MGKESLQKWHNIGMNLKDLSDSLTGRKGGKGVQGRWNSICKQKRSEGHPAREEGCGYKRGLPVPVIFLMTNSVDNSCT